MSDLLGCRILVLGAGGSGCAAASLARAHGAEVTIVDSAPREKFASILSRLEEQGIQLECGVTVEKWDGPEIYQVVVSPGIPLDSPLHRLGESTGAPMIGEVDFGASYIDCPILAVTGTNGKTTTVELLSACLDAAGYKVRACGNIGLPVSQVALEGARLDYLVVEISSFQMESSVSFKPRGAILLNVTPDHLDRHGTLECYRGLKTKLLSQVESGGAVVYHAALEKFVALNDAVRRSRLWLCGEHRDFDGRPDASDWAVESDGLYRLRENGEGEKILSRSGLQLCGSHNLANALAVIAMLDALGINAESYSAALRSFQSGPHRIKVISVRHDVQFVDDSKATDVDAMIQALRTFGTSAGKGIHLIAGGLAKGCTLSEAEPEIRMYVKAVYLIGECKERLASSWKQIVPCTICESMAEAVNCAAEAAIAGETVLLSPGCASMDMFRSYADRGQCFIDAVNALPECAADGAES